jgi:hypothetical protein
MMHRALHLLIMVSVLMCGVHFGETAQAHAAVDEHQTFSHTDAQTDQGDDNDRTPANAAHAMHHHCPVATDLRVAFGVEAISIGKAIPFATPVAALGSLSQAPPVEPPLA